MLRIRSLNSQRRVPSKLFRIIWNILFSTIFTSSDHNLTTKWKQQTNGMNWRVDNGKIIRSLLIFSNEGQGGNTGLYLFVYRISRKRDLTRQSFPFEYFGESLHVARASGRGTFRSLLSVLMIPRPPSWRGFFTRLESSLLPN